MASVHIDPATDFTLKGREELRKWAHTAGRIVRKFGDMSPLVPWLPPEMVDWEGPWLLRPLCRPVAALLVDGLKQFEIMAATEWIYWGAQGVMICAIYQCDKELNGLEKYVPPNVKNTNWG